MSEAIDNSLFALTRREVEALIKIALEEAFQCRNFSHPSAPAKTPKEEWKLNKLDEWIDQV